MNGYQTTMFIVVILLTLIILSWLYLFKYGKFAIKNFTNGSFVFQINGKEFKIEKIKTEVDDEKIQISAYIDNDILVVKSENREKGEAKTDQRSNMLVYVKNGASANAKTFTSLEDKGEIKIQKYDDNQKLKIEFNGILESENEKMEIKNGTIQTEFNTKTQNNKNSIKSILYITGLTGLLAAVWFFYNAYMGIFHQKASWATRIAGSWFRGDEIGAWAVAIGIFSLITAIFLIIYGTYALRRAFEA